MVKADTGDTKENRIQSVRLFSYSPLLPEVTVQEARWFHLLQFLLLKAPHQLSSELLHSMTKEIKVQINSVEKSAAFNIFLYINMKHKKTLKTMQGNTNVILKSNSSYIQFLLHNMMKSTPGGTCILYKYTYNVQNMVSFVINAFLY